jgi:serpin B
LGVLADCGSDRADATIVDPDASRRNEDAPATMGPDGALPSPDRSDGALPGPDTLPVMDVSSIVDGGQPSSTLQREPDPQVPAADMSTLASDDGAFAFDLYKKLKADSGNIVFSPASVSIALSMTYAGAANATAAEMAQALHFTLPQDRLHRAFNALEQTLISRGQDVSGGAMRLTIANSLWMEQSFSLLPSFLDVLALNYGAGVNLVDFIHAPDASRLKINAWVADKTAGKITELLARDMITDLTRLVLANAVYFNAAWENPFNALYNHANNFTLLDGSIATRSFMYASLSASAIQGANFVAVNLPYQDPRLSMVVVVPDAGTFAAVEESLDWTSLVGLVKGLSFQRISLYLPQFHIDTRASLPSMLKSLGMTSAFCPEAADFSGMTTEQLCISQVIHEAFINVAEKGTEAGAATAVVLADSGIAGDAGPPPLLVRADRPFLYFIYDNPTGTILFMGRVLDPLQN